jgi:hypothetical protein
MWATQEITHSLPNVVPSVRVLIDFVGTGQYIDNQIVHVTYLSGTQILITAEASIAQYNNGRGKVVIQ